MVAEPDFSFAWLWRARRDVDILHFHWRPDKYYSWARPKPGTQEFDRPPPRSQGMRSWLRLATFAAKLRSARILGYRVAWTIHEVLPPETVTRPPGSISRRLDRIGSRLLARRCDVLLCHDAATKGRAREELGKAADHIEVVAHGSYLEVYPRGRGREKVRHELEIPANAFTFLCFGAVRPDKSIDFVLQAFSSIENDDLALVVAGDVEDARSRRSLLAAAAADPRIKLRLEFVPHDSVRELFDAADAAVIGRSEVWTSGSLILSLSLGVPVIAAALPPSNELLDHGCAGWLFRPADADSLRAQMLEAAGADDEAVRAKKAAAICQAQRLPSWAEIAARTAALMREATRRDRRRR
jgi:glycosyltransferase involved in cell wall biosynthesis